MPKRFFAADSFWNTPIENNPAIDARSDEFIALLESEPNGPWGINLEQWTIPVFEADSSTPRREIKQRVMPEDILKDDLSKWVGVGDCFRMGPGFGKDVPIPDAAVPDPENDAHFAVIDWEAGKCWDMWAATITEDGQWYSNTGMVYDINGSGVFKLEDLGDVQDGDSIHFHGPSRAAGVPAIAGLIMHDEISEGKINHRLACATRFNAFKEFTFPAIWTDGHREGGIPEGTIFQLDPELDLEQFDLLPGEFAVARALQEYGCVNVDNAGGSALYGEGLWAKPQLSWDGLIRPLGLQSIPMKHYRVLELGPITKMGDRLRGKRAR